MSQVIMKPRPATASPIQQIQIGTKVRSYHPRYYNYLGVVVGLDPLKVRVAGEVVEIQRVDLEVVTP